MLLGISLGLTAQLLGTITPAVLFASGEVGAWYDPSDLTTLFQDTAGTTPVTAAGQSVALVLDKSRGLVLGPELVTNGDFSNGLTGWTLIGTGNTSTVSNGVAQISGTTSPGLRRAGILTAGLTYRISLRIRRTAGTVATFYVPTPPFAPTLTGDWQTFTYYGVATGANFEVGISGAATGTVIEVDDISVRELPGNHATQSTAASRPLYALHPSSGIRNLANGSADVGNATYWPATQTVNGVTITRVASGLDVDGLPYADFSVVGTASADSFIPPYATALSRIAAATGQQYTGSFLSKVISGTPPPAGSGIRVEIVGETAPSTNTETGVGALFNGTAETLVSFSYTLANAATNQTRVRIQTVTLSGVTVNYTVRIKALQFELGSTRTNYQFNYANFNIVEAPFSQVGNLLFDGVDDFLVTPTINPEAGVVAFGSNLLTGSWLLTVDGGTATATESPAGTLNLTGDGTNGANARQSFTTVVGRTYQIAVTVGSSAGSIFLGTTTGGIDVLPATTLNTGTQIVAFTARSTTTHVTFRKSGAALSTMSAITAREATGKPDSVQVFAGVRKLSDAAIGTVVELTAAGDANNGGMYLRAPTSVGGANYQATSRGTINSATTATGFSAPITNIVTFEGDIAGDRSALRINQTAFAPSVADQGTGNYAAAPIYIGRRGGTTLPFNGRLYGLIVRFGPNLDAARIAQIERWVGQRTGVTIQ